MRVKQHNRKSIPQYQFEKLERSLFDLGPEVNSVALSNGRRLIYRSAMMRRLLEEVAIFAPLQCDILIFAETGAGKELIAQAIHEWSGRNGPFIDLNCAAIPEHLAESLMFGHVKGAFTGATDNAKGIFEEAQGGTVFLDEFGELAPACQAKMLRVLQERKITRVGRWGVEIPIDVRIVGATNRDMGLMVMGSVFREDLIHRFHKDITIPPLRERPEDILPLAKYFIGELLRKKVVDRRLGLSPSAEQALTAYDFPGNVRELEKVIFHASVVTCAEGAPVIKGGKMAEAIEAGRWKRSEPGGVRTSQKEGRLDVAIETQSSHGALPFRIPKVETLDDTRTRDVLEALQQYGGNQAKAAKAIGISRQAIRHHLKKLLVRLDFSRRD